MVDFREGVNYLMIDFSIALIMVTIAFSALFTMRTILLMNRNKELDRTERLNVQMASAIKIALSAILVLVMNFYYELFADVYLYLGAIVVVQLLLSGTSFLIAGKYKKVEKK